MQGGALLANSRPVGGVFIVGVLGITFAVLGRGEFSIPPYQFFNPWRTDMIHIIGIIAQTIFAFIQYLCQLRKAEGGLSGMNTAQAGDLVENLGQ